ncbi:hypothetical protein ACM64Y_03460 [Novispirillum sp. DQ9]|uniref:hypothetical protein n=1 Tax=Novispirillum sp. DQ9 TaxID=3398612 RepID=UPI003C7EDA23
MAAIDTLRNQSMAALLRNHAVEVLATQGAPLKNPSAPGLFVRDLLPQATFSSGAVRFYDTAPQLYAVFDDDPPRNPGIFRFSKPQAFVELSDQAGADTVPVYVIPYEDDTTIGVKLPAGDTVAYAVTATMNGCTLSVSGDPRSPLVSHSNVKETPDFSKAAMLSVRLDMLRIVAQRKLDHPPLLQHTDLSSQPARLEVFSDAQAPGVTHVNYFKSTVTPSGNNLARMRVHGQTVHQATHYLTTSEVEYRPKKGEVSNLFSNDRIVNLTMMGERRNGTWTFYHQQSQVIAFEAWDVVRWRATGGEKIRVKRNGILSCSAILNWGEFWPNQTSNPEAF